MARTPKIDRVSQAAYIFKSTHEKADFGICVFAQNQDQVFAMNILVENYKRVNKYVEFSQIIEGDISDRPYLYKEYRCIPYLDFFIDIMDSCLFIGAGEVSRSFSMSLSISDKEYLMEKLNIISKCEIKSVINLHNEGVFQ